MQRAHQARLRKPGVERLGSVQRIGIYHHDRVERRALAVVGLDAVEIHLHELAAGELLGPHRGMNVGNRGLVRRQQPERRRSWQGRNDEQKCDPRRHARERECKLSHGWDSAYLATTTLRRQDVDVRKIRWSAGDRRAVVEPDRLAAKRLNERHMDLQLRVCEARR